MAAGVVVVSRLRKDAALWTVPVPPRPGQPEEARPAADVRQAGASAWPSGPGQRRGWQTAEFVLYGESGDQDATRRSWRPSGRPAG